MQSGTFVHFGLAVGVGWWAFGNGAAFNAQQAMTFAKRLGGE